MFSIGPSLLVVAHFCGLVANMLTLSKIMADSEGIGLRAIMESIS